MSSRLGAISIQPEIGVSNGNHKKKIQTTSMRTLEDQRQSVDSVKLGKNPVKL
jgi:hypothetical protein